MDRAREALSYLQFHPRKGSRSKTGKCSTWNSLQYSSMGVAWGEFMPTAPVYAQFQSVKETSCASYSLSEMFHVER
jgi:hypothetical protein